MSDSSDPGEMNASVDGGVLTIRRRTYRSGDFVHVIFSVFAAVFAILILVIAIANNTLFDGTVTPIVIGALSAYCYFGATRLVNSRVITVTTDRVTAKDGPLSQFVRTIDSSITTVEPISVESSKRWAFPMITNYRVYNVATATGPDLFRRLRNENEAKYALSKIETFVGQSRD